MDAAVILGWIGAAISLIGAFLVSGKVSPRLGFATMLIADILLSIIQIEKGIWNQVSLMAAFAVMNIVGIVRYR